MSDFTVPEKAYREARITVSPIRLLGKQPERDETIKHIVDAAAPHIYKAGYEAGCKAGALTELEWLYKTLNCCDTVHLDINDRIEKLRQEPSNE